MSTLPLLAVLISSLCFAAPRESQRISWQEVVQTTKNKNVSITLPSGTKIRGSVLGAEPQTLVFDVTQTSNAKEIPKGTASLARTSVTSMKASQCSRKMRILLTIGIPASALVATAAAINAQSPPVKGGEALGVGVAVAAAGVVGGYFIGKKLDCHVTEFVISE